MHLGRFCAKRTQSFHEFTHWEVRHAVVELQFYLTRSSCPVETVRPVVDRGARTTIDEQEGVRQGCVRQGDPTTEGSERWEWDYGLVGSAGGHYDGLDGNETDDGESEEAGVNGPRGEG